MDIGKKSNKVKHFQTIEKKQINGQNTKGEKKRLKVQNNIHTKNSKALICFETKEEAGINQYPVWKASLYKNTIQNTGKSRRSKQFKQFNRKEKHEKTPNLSSKT